MSSQNRPLWAGAPDEHSVRGQREKDRLPLRNRPVEALPWLRYENTPVAQEERVARIAPGEYSPVVVGHPVCQVVQLGLLHE